MNKRTNGLTNHQNNVSLMKYALFFQCFCGLKIAQDIEEGSTFAESAEERDLVIGGMAHKIMTNHQK